ncbi:peptidylprolyl isomerase [Fontivita pretiosa]|uniref:peptidylprolyl isomerase n=1 Tax=Fontivita pretiosa TaxID=2989684 RepID=UPI003D17AA34
MRIPLLDRVIRSLKVIGRARSVASASPAGFVEPLEQRRHLHANVTGMFADHRGEVTIAVSAPLDPTTVHKKSVYMYTAGADGALGTADDTRVVASVRYSNQRITIRGTVRPTEQYRVRLISSTIKASDGDFLDGEFTGRFPSGNGVPGGIFDVRTKFVRTGRPLARWSTSAGAFNVSLFTDLTPKNVANFLRYVNAGLYDNMIFTRAETGFVIQGGGIKIDSRNELEDVEAFSPVQGEPGVSNTRGRLSLALTGSPNSGTNEFFFNLGNNTFLDDTSTGSGPFTAFGEVVGAAGLAVLDAIAAKPRINFANLNPPLSFPGTLTNSVPVNDATQAQAGLNPLRDLIVVRRISLRMKVVPLA